MALNRRHFLAASIALPASLRALAQPHAAQPHADAARYVLLGTNTGAGISRAAWNPQTGELGQPELAIAATHPIFFAMHPRLPVLYTTNETTGPGAAITAYRLDRTKASLTLLNRISSQADGPCFVSVDRTGRMAFAADYAGGGFAAYRLASDGSLASVAGKLLCAGNPVCGTLGPNKDRQDAPHLHCATVSPHNDFVLACDLGDDNVQVFPISAAQQKLGAPTRIVCRAGSGPRHIAFHPNGRWAYIVHELDCTVDLYDWSVHEGKPQMRLRPQSVVSTLLPQTPLTGNTGCEVIVSESGRFVYTCTRGIDQVIVYAVNAQTGLLTEQQRISSGGKIPRMISFDPTRKWLLCSNQGSSNVAVLAHEPHTGKLTSTSTSIDVDTPMCVEFV
jgi:6-phosphogluconolactonase